MRIARRGGVRRVRRGEERRGEEERKEERKERKEDRSVEEAKAKRGRGDDDGRESTTCLLARGRELKSTTALEIPSRRQTSGQERTCCRLGRCRCS